MTATLTPLATPCARSMDIGSKRVSVATSSKLTGSPAASA